MKKILILGGTGAMGAPLVDILNKKGYRIYVTTRQKRISSENITYKIGNAHEIDMLNAILYKNTFEAIIDFMSYKTEEFRERVHILLQHTKQYIFLSSARVFANNDRVITESSPRLLETSMDDAFLSSDAYALAKARSEDILRKFRGGNWTIIRPYITYNDFRLQLVALEKESWLKRALDGFAIPFPNDTSNRMTTLTYGGDVAQAISMLIGNNKALGEDFNITCTEAYTWREILEIYQDVFESKLGRRLNVWEPLNSNAIEVVMNNGYQILYDRMYDRIFDNTKLLDVCHEIHFKSPKEALKECMENFLKDQQWRPMNEARRCAIYENFK